MHASCPSCRTPIPGPALPEACPACGADLLAAAGAAPGPRLVLVSADGLSAEFDLTERAGIGRHYDNEVVVADREVSKRHAVVERTPDGFVLQDLGSANGTFVNGRRIDRITLREGDEVRVGASRLLFRDRGGVPKNVTVVRSANFTRVVASARPAAGDETDAFLPASEIGERAHLEKDYERLRIAHRFHQEGALLTDREALFRLILRLALEWLPADSGVILVPEDEGGPWRDVVAESRLGEPSIDVSQTLLDQVAATGEGLLSQDAITDRRFSGAESMVARGVRSVMAVPVVTHGALRAVVYLESKSQASLFTPKDLEVLAGIAGQAAVSLHNAELVDQVRREEVARGQLERFLSPALVQQVARGELDLKKGGSVVRATVLFSDIRGFTSLSERQSAEEVVRMLNEYFEEMVDVVFEHQGVLDKFIGDAVMALWGVPVAGEDDAERAVRAALEMQRRTAEFNRRREEEGKKPIFVGIGVNTGECVVGNMGSSRRLEYTVIGDAVNLASRLCDLAGPSEVIVSEDTAAAVDGRFDLEALPERPVKGKARPVATFRVRGAAGEG